MDLLPTVDPTPARHKQQWHLETLHRICNVHLAYLTQADRVRLRQQEIVQGRQLVLSTQAVPRLVDKSLSGQPRIGGR